MASTTQSSESLKEGLVTGNDYKLAVDLLTSDGQSLSITNIIINFNYYEDIFSAYVSGDLEIGDAHDILTNFSFNGNEYIKISLDKPSLDKPITKYFRVYKISDRDNTRSQSLQKYTLHFCSEELILSTQILVRKAYKGLPVSSIIKDILTTILKVDSSKMGGLFSTTSGNFDLIIPKMQPLEACQWLKSRGYNDSKTAYFFFENRYGYNYVCYEDLLTQNAYRTFSRTPKVDPDPSQVIDSYNYIAFPEEFDIIKGNRYGAFSGSIFTYDLLSRKYDSVSLSSASFESQKNLLNPNLQTNFSPNRFNRSLYDAPDSMQKFYLTTDSDPNSNPTLPQKWILPQAIKLAGLNSRKIVLNVPFDSMLTAGQIIALNLPLMEPQTTSYTQDKYRSGRYLISSVRHGISGHSASTTLELLCDSFAEKLPLAITTSTTLQDFKSK